MIPNGLPPFVRVGYVIRPRCYNSTLYTPRMITGYSDRINHALAYAAKHHDQQVRRGTRAPYFTQPANVAIILTRYGCADEIVIGAILRDVIEDAVRQGATHVALSERFGEKFGQPVLDAVLAVVLRRNDADGVELTSEERKSDVLARLAVASDDARWIFAADALHHAASLLADLRRTVDPSAVWNRGGVNRDITPAWYRGAVARLREVHFAAPIVGELAGVADALEEWRDR